MTVNFDGESFREVVETAKRCRMEQLEGKFSVWSGYTEALDKKDAVMQSMEALLPVGVRELLREHDDACAVMVYRAQDYFYTQGFQDGINLAMKMVFDGQK